ncbi:MAG: hypothetical protein FIA99_02570 [Ruminiclostridium sp.]|nr:hypothetical protein [Ruminiclostridium sp.]
MENKMTSRQRVVTALNHKEPDRVPVDFGSSHNCSIHLDAYLNLRKYLGLKGCYNPEFISFFDQCVRPEEEVLEKLDIDMRGLNYSPPKDFVEKSWREDDREFREDAYGVIWEKPDHVGIWDIAKYPLENASAEEIRKYSKYANPEDRGLTEGLKERGRKLFEETDYAIVADIQAGSVIEAVWFLTGLVRYLMDMACEPENIQPLCDRINEIYKIMSKRMMAELEAYAQVIAANGDLGTQESLLISPVLYRQFLKPYEADFYGYLKKISGVPVVRHSCGSIMEILPDFIECGIDGIHPIQVSAKGMDTRALKEKFGSKLIFWGGIDTHKVLPYGSKREVRDEVRRRIRDLAPGGGYILGAVHNIQAEVPPQNVCTMFEAAKEFGAYPINC